jgi:hypothetical protein
VSNKVTVRFSTSQINDSIKKRVKDYDLEIGITGHVPEKGVAFVS